MLSKTVVEGLHFWKAGVVRESSCARDVDAIRPCRDPREDRVAQTHRRKRQR